MNAPEFTLRWKGVRVGKQPPWILRLCRTPDTGRALRACGYDSAKCTGPPQTCPACGFPYCQGHYNAHELRLSVPRDGTKTYLRRLYKALNRRAKAPDDPATEMELVAEWPE